MAEARRQKRIGLFGGTFDPVHIGHVQVAEAAVEAAQLDILYFLPCRQSPHKSSGAIASEMQRVEMLRLATQGLPWARVSDWELHQPSPSYSWKTAEHFASEHQGAKLYWLMGADQWKVIGEWNRVEHLLSIVTAIIHTREAFEVEETENEMVIEGHHPASATQIRNVLGKGQKPRSEWLNANVADYIERQGLYRE